MNLNTSGDSEFWNHIPDHMLETIYGQLEKSRDGIPRRESVSETPSSSHSATSSSSEHSGSSRLAGDDHEDHDLDRTNSLPPLFFPSPMIQNNSFSLVEELPVDLFHSSLGQTPNPLTPSSNPVSAVFSPPSFEAGPISFISLTAQAIKDESHTTDI